MSDEIIRWRFAYTRWFLIPWESIMHNEVLIERTIYQRKAWMWFRWTLGT